MYHHEFNLEEVINNKLFQSIIKTKKVLLNINNYLSCQQKNLKLS